MVEQKLATQIDLKLNDGNSLPALGLGTVSSGDHLDVKNQVVAAVKAGYRHIDTAWYYGTEKYVGQALKQIFEEGIAKREDLFITTKVWPCFYKNPEISLKQSLHDLGLDYVDLVLQHWPVCFRASDNGQPATPYDESGNIIYDDDPIKGTEFIKFYNRIEDFKRETGKVKSIGVSNYSIPRLKKLLKGYKTYLPVVNQIEYHPQLPQQKLVEFCKEHQIVVVAYSPVGGTGAPILKLPYILQLAEKYKVSSNEIANAYHILNGRGTLPRSSNLARIKTNIKLPSLTKEELDELYKIGENNPQRYVNDIWGRGLGFQWWEGDNLSTVFE